MKMRSSLLFLAASTAVSQPLLCPNQLQAVFADMHDGDQKEVTISGTSLTIKPSGNNQTWAVHTKLDPVSCYAVVDFNVPGKPGPPPVNLSATMWFSDFTGTLSKEKAELEFTDPSGTLAAEGFPLNRWVELGTKETPPTACPHSLSNVYADMHDGDKKHVAISGTSMTIKPSGNKETWVVNAEVDTKSCSAIVNFNVPGKPSPPPVNLTATLFSTISDWPLQTKTEIKFTDPSGTLAAKDFPLNRWVQIQQRVHEENLVLF